MNTTQGTRPQRSTHIARQTRASRFSRNALLILAGALALTLVGCGGAGSTVIKGRVIAGAVGQSVAAAPGDERFEEQGIPGAKIAILDKQGNVSRGRGVYAKTTSDMFGNFEIKFANGQYPRDAVQVRVEGEGIFNSRSSTYLPKDGEDLLCVVIVRPGHVFPEPEEQQ